MRIPYGRVQGSGYNACTGKYCIICPGGTKKKLLGDPGAQKAIFKRGVKYAEQVRDHRKSSISIMFCGSAAGDFLPPYVVYKGKNTYEAWTTGGPKGAAYSCSKSRWFDMFCLTEWFKKIFLPNVQRQGS
jgi:DDE superfamily endonuclease